MKSEPGRISKFLSDSRGRDYLHYSPRSRRTDSLRNLDRLGETATYTVTMFLGDTYHASPPGPSIAKKLSS
jgi:hypothetical protein